MKNVIKYFFIGIGAVLILFGLFHEVIMPEISGPSIKKKATDDDEKSEFDDATVIPVDDTPGQTQS